MRAITHLGYRARRILVEGAEGSVVAVFERSAYVDIGGQLICVAGPSVDIGPLVAICSDFKPIELGSRFQGGEGPCRVWHPPVAFGWTDETLSRGLAALEGNRNPLQLEHGLAAFVFELNERTKLSSVAKVAEKPVALLRSWLAEVLSGGRDEVPVEIGALVGLGPGLTPSGDDFLGGAMIAAHALNRADVAEQLCAAALSAGVIGLISEAHLHAARDGAASAPLHEMVNDVLCGRVEHFPARMRALDRMGHSSGWDAFAGAIAVLRVANRSYQILNSLRGVA